MAITSLITAQTAAATADLDITGNVVLVATKLVLGEKVTISIYGLAGDTEQAVNHNHDLILDRTNNSAQLIGPSKYLISKSITSSALGVGYHA